MISGRMAMGDEQAPVCAEASEQSAAQCAESDAAEIALFADAEALRLSLMVQDLASGQLPLQVRDEGQPGALRYSLSDNVSTSMSYHSAFLFERDGNEEVRTNRFSSLSTARQRDVVGLGMDWGLGENSVLGFGYQLQSIRPDGGFDPAASGGPSSILPRSDGLDHAFTFGVSRSWGAAE